MRGPFAEPRKWHEPEIQWDLVWAYLDGKSRRVNDINWPRGWHSDTYEVDNLWVIYTLRKPGKPVQYVGITRGNPAIRYKAHAHGGSRKKLDWFNSGPRPVMEIVSTIRGSLRMAVEAETTLTRYYAERGHEMLNREACFVV